RMRMAVDIDPPRGDGIDQLAASTRVQVNALATLDRHRLRIKRFLRERVPDGERFGGHLKNISSRNCCEKPATALRDRFYRATVSIRQREQRRTARRSVRCLCCGCRSSLCP